MKVKDLIAALSDVNIQPDDDANVVGRNVVIGRKMIALKKRGVFNSMLVLADIDLDRNTITKGFGLLQLGAEVDEQSNPDR